MSLSWNDLAERNAWALVYLFSNVECPIIVLLDICGVHSFSVSSRYCMDGALFTFSKVDHISGSTINDDFARNCSPLAVGTHPPFFVIGIVLGLSVLVHFAFFTICHLFDFSIFFHSWMPQHWSCVWRCKLKMYCQGMLSGVHKTPEHIWSNSGYYVQLCRYALVLMRNFCIVFCVDLHEVV